MEGFQKLSFGYDYMGRRVRKTVYTYKGTSETWVQTGDVKYVWAGWLLLLELDGTDSDAVLRKYTWGLDVAGQNGQLNSLASAGGIGGLLAVYDTNGTTTGQNPTEDDKTYVYLYDANGNVGQLVDWADIPDWGTKGLNSGQDWHADRLVARYEYDPYGNVVGPDTDSDGDWTDDAGPYATVNAFRFSTKQWDDETGLGYWGYRYYSPTLGRWISRDPIGEGDGINLYVFARNCLTSSVDGLGLCVSSNHGKRWRDGDIECDRCGKKLHSRFYRNVLWYQVYDTCHVCGSSSARIWAEVEQEATLEEAYGEKAGSGCVCKKKGVKEKLRAAILKEAEGSAKLGVCVGSCGYRVILIIGCGPLWGPLIPASDDYGCISSTSMIGDVEVKGDGASKRMGGMVRVICRGSATVKRTCTCSVKRTTIRQSARDALHDVLRRFRDQQR